MLEEVEASLLGADVGVGTADRLIERLRATAGGDPRESIQELKRAMADVLASVESKPIDELVRTGPKTLRDFGGGRQWAWGKPRVWRNWPAGCASRG